MKYDIFTFNNELDMLDIRLNVLNDYVDYFVIVESTETFSGVPKSLYYELNKDRFSEFHHKIIHHIIDDTPESFTDSECNQEVLEIASNSDNVTRDNLCWLKEFYQKELIKEALVNLNDDDICFVSDVDEIWNYELDYNIVGDGIYKPKIDKCYINYLNSRTNENWTQFTGPIVTKYENIKDVCLNHLRTQRKMNHIYIFMENGGWHFNALGGIEKKVEDFQHYVYNIGYMRKRASGSWVDDEGLPKYIINNKEKYKELFL
jgi:beta-1,4-mannosyl-glycoprotein beta-1,4-N-acetylglucosaminyltransferase